MLMHLTIAVFFTVNLVIAFFEDYLKEDHKKVILAVYALFMILLATIKSIDHTADALIYEHIFYNNDEMLVVLTTEPTFLILSRIVLAIGGSLWVMFFLYALITIPFKLKALNRLTPFIFTALMIYIPVYFELHDLIQIRAAAASMFLLTAFIPLAEKRYWPTVLLMGTAILFHYSSAIFLPFLLIGNRQLGYWGRVTVACLVPFCFLMYPFSSSLARYECTVAVLLIPRACLISRTVGEKPSERILSVIYSSIRLSFSVSGFISDSSLSFSINYTVSR
jgi:hypothetical protein